MTTHAAVYRIGHDVAGVGTVTLWDYQDGTYAIVRTDVSRQVTSELGDAILIGEDEAYPAYVAALEHLHWLATPAGRNAARDIAVDDALRGGRHGA